MSLWRHMTTASRVAGSLGYHCTYGAVVNPSASRAFIREVANAIADFRHRPKVCIPQRWLDELCPGIGTEDGTARSGRTYAELPALELLCLRAIVRHLRPAVSFEIGTNRGRTTRLIAEQAPEHAKVYTLDLPPEQIATREHIDAIASTGEVGEAYRNRPIASKITQLFGNSRTFDFSRFYGKVDFIFIDADHSYEAVKHDTAQALRMIRPGGVIVWDDCTLVHAGVVRCLEELAASHPVSNIRMTRLAYCAVD